MNKITNEKCAITGKPAKYRDPVTGLPYSDLAAFKVIREQHATASAAAHRQQMDVSTTDPPTGHADNQADQEEDTITAHQLEALDAREDVNSMLRHDSALREMVREVDNAQDRVAALHKMRLNPKFDQLMLHILDTVSPAP